MLVDQEPDSEPITDGEIAKNYKMRTTKWHGGHDVTVVDPSDISRFFDDFYR